VANQSASHERQGVDRAGCYRQALRLSVGTVLSEYAANKIIHLAEDLAKLAEDELPPASAKPIAVNGEYTGTRRNT
jgi:hypothetical protein